MHRGRTHSAGDELMNVAVAIIEPHRQSVRLLPLTRGWKSCAEAHAPVSCGD